MARIDDSERVFDVSRPHRVNPIATSKPIIVGHHPRSLDPMVKSDVPPPSTPETKVTTVPVKVHGSEPSTQLSSNTKHNQQWPANALPPPAPTKEAPPQETTRPTPGYTPGALETQTAQATHGDWGNLTSPTVPRDPGLPPGELPMVEVSGPGPGGRFKKILTWSLTLMALTAIAGYLAIDAGLVGANIKLPFEIFKEEEKPERAATTPTPQPAASLPPKDLPKKELPAFVLRGDWTAYENQAIGLKLAHPKVWRLTGPSTFEQVSVTIASPDFKTIPNNGTPATYISDGGILDASVEASNIKDPNVLRQEGAIDYFKAESTVTIDGVEGVYGTCGRYEPGYCVFVLHRGNLYRFSYTQPKADLILERTGKAPLAPKDKYLPEFNTFLSSIDFIAP